MQFDTDNDGYLSISELKRAFRAIGLKKRSGEKNVMDLAMFAKCASLRQEPVFLALCTLMHPSCEGRRIVGSCGGFY